MADKPAGRAECYVAITPIKFGVTDQLPLPE
jgi:hypothetical protein